MVDPIETFNWPVRITSTGQQDTTVITNQFGDGYEQTAEDGINGDRESWDIEITAEAAVIVAVRAFLKAHRGGTRAFFWAPPLGELSLYKCKVARRIAGNGKPYYTLSTTFEQAFHP